MWKKMKKWRHYLAKVSMQRALCILLQIRRCFIQTIRLQSLPRKQSVAFTEFNDLLLLFFFKELPHLHLSFLKGGKSVIWHRRMLTLVWIRPSIPLNPSNPIVDLIPFPLIPPKLVWRKRCKKEESATRSPDGLGVACLRPTTAQMLRRQMDLLLIISMAHWSSCSREPNWFGEHWRAKRRPSATGNECLVSRGHSSRYFFLFCSSIFFSLYISIALIL